MACECCSGAQPVCGEPRLGLATTERLLQELETRGRVDATPAGTAMAADIQAIWNRLPAPLLHYRTVDH